METIRGTVETVTFRNEENGFTVLKLGRDAGAGTAGTAGDRVACVGVVLRGIRTRLVRP